MRKGVAKHNCFKGVSLYRADTAYVVDENDHFFRHHFLFDGVDLEEQDKEAAANVAKAKAAAEKEEADAKKGKNKDK